MRRGIENTFEKKNEKCCLTNVESLSEAAQVIGAEAQADRRAAVGVQTQQTDRPRRHTSFLRGTFRAERSPTAEHKVKLKNVNILSNQDKNA